MNDELELRLKLPRADFVLEVDLRLPLQGITVLFGPSGSGKTSVLRALAGLERAREARVRMAAQVWQDEATGVWVPTHRRALGYVFQEPSLLSHLNVMGNLQYGLRRSVPSGMAASQAQARLHDAIELLGIGHLLQRSNDSLSGGERQRVAIARALATQPQLLLLDEPLAALDPARRQEILPWLQRVRQQWQIPMLMVTHAIEDVVRLADHLVLLDRGRVQACGPLLDVMALRQGVLAQGEEPAALLQARVVERSAPWHLARVAFEGGELWLRDVGLEPGHTLRLRVPAKDVSLATEQPQGSSVQNILPVVVQALQDDEHPSQMLVVLRCGPTQLVSRVTRRACSELALEPGRQVWALVKAAAIAA